MKKKRVVSFGEVMLRFSAPDYQKIEQAEQFDLSYGGSEMNVSASLARFGIDACHVTVFPKNLIGEKAANYLKQLNLDTRYVVEKGQRMGLYYIEKGASMRASQIVYDRENSAFQNLDPAWFDWEEILNETDWFHWSGITAALSQSAATACLDAVKTAQKLGITVSSDIYYRSDQWKYGKKPQDVLPELASYSNVLLANEANMHELLGAPLSSGHKSFERTSHDTMKMYQRINKVVNTNRVQISSHHNKISSMLYDGEKLLTSQENDITYIVDRVGGGDAFLGGFIYGQLIYEDDLKSICFGTAASALKHTIPGDINLAGIEEIENVMLGDSSGRIKR
ncbi:sugar kinase [Jiulongibacter sediminis]|uniref:sugar kinase n=1 Tax=Jiulongibacter sediminis TaxID=1605367 RepID=UPI0026F161D9|nr:sugar kinase [Jiulongibacter sediminis]